MGRSGEASVACRWHTSPRPPGCNLQTDRHQQKTAAPHGRTLSSPGGRARTRGRSSAPPLDRLTRSPPSHASARPRTHVRARLPAVGRHQTTVAVPHARCSGGEEARALPVSQRRRPAGVWPPHLPADRHGRPGRRPRGRRARDASAGRRRRPARRSSSSSARSARRPPSYISSAKRLAAQARSYGATVYEVYSPHATWSRVRSVSQGANLFIYLGHGNGWPSPYGPFQRVHEGRPRAERRATAARSVKYYGEYYVDRYLNFAPNSVVILNRLCYASGNNEWGSGYPTKSTAIKRVDNFGAGFLRTGARAVFAEGVDSAGLHPVGPVQVDEDDQADLLLGSRPRHALGLQLPLRRGRPARSACSIPRTTRTTTTGR